MHAPKKHIKQIALIITLLLSGCSGEMPLLLPDRQELKFKCDLDPYKQGCERMMDYQEHFRAIKKPTN